MTHALFLPGAGGDAAFWHPAGALLPAAWGKTYLGWPGLGAQPHDPAMRGLDDLVARAAAALASQTVVVAQSMGGVIAVRLALAHPETISHLVLVATSGGLDLTRFGVSDWRPDYRRNFPNAAAWITEARADHEPDFPRLTLPIQLIWGDRDPISPVAVGTHLARALPNARLAIIEGGTHALATEQPARVAALIEQRVAS